MNFDKYFFHLILGALFGYQIGEVVSSKNHLDYSISVIGLVIIIIGMKINWPNHDTK